MEQQKQEQSGSKDKMNTQGVRNQGQDQTQDRKQGQQPQGQQNTQKHSQTQDHSDSKMEAKKEDKPGVGSMETSEGMKGSARSSEQKNKGQSSPAGFQADKER